MQPTSLNGGSDALPPASTLLDAREAWSAGDYARCLAVIDEPNSPLAEVDRREMLLLKGRALIRLRRPEEVVRLLGPVLSAFTAVDEICTARMLHGTAVARAQNPARGLKLLLETETAARAFNAHRALRGEIAYEVAHAYWLMRDCERTLEYALLAEAARADVISVRAASLRGFVAIVKECYRDALALFRSARRAYDDCSAKDQALVELLVVQIATLEVALRSRDVSGTHTAGAADGTRLPQDGQPRTAIEFRAVTATMDAWLYAFEGDRTNAYRMARRAECLAPDSAWRIWVVANRAKIFAAFGDLHVAGDFAEAALEVTDSVDWGGTTSEARVALLHLAEILAQTDPAAAVRVYNRYASLTSEVDRAFVFRSDLRLWIFETFVRGLVHRIRGETSESRTAFESVYTAAVRAGILWRAALALIELDATPVQTRPSGQHHLQDAAVLVRENFPRSFLARRLGRWTMAHDDPIARTLAAQPREVLRHLLAGKNSTEIAMTLGLAEGTVRNYIKGLHRAFGVHSTPQLLVACNERGIGAPAWWDALVRDDDLLRRHPTTIAKAKPPKPARKLMPSAEVAEAVFGQTEVSQSRDRFQPEHSDKPGIGHAV